MDVQSKIVTLLAELLRTDEDTIQMESYLNETLGIDSATAIEMIFEVEDRFGLEIPNEDVQGFKQVKDIVEYIQSRLQSKQLSPTT